MIWRLKAAYTLNLQNRLPDGTDAHDGVCLDAHAVNGLPVGHVIPPLDLWGLKHVRDGQQSLPFEPPLGIFLAFVDVPTIYKELDYEENKFKSKTFYHLLLSFTFLVPSIRMHLNVTENFVTPSIYFRV